MRILKGTFIAATAIASLQSGPAYPAAMCYRCDMGEDRWSCLPELELTDVFSECKVVDVWLFFEDGSRFTPADRNNNLCVLTKPCHLNDRAERGKGGDRCEAVA